MAKSKVVVTRRLPRVVEKPLRGAFDVTSNDASRTLKMAEPKKAIMPARRWFADGERPHISTAK